MIKATAITDTILKDSVRNSTECDDTATAKRGTVLELSHYRLDNQSKHQYFLIRPKDSSDQGYEGQTRWFGYAPDWQIEGTEPNNNPTESKAIKSVVQTVPAIVKPAEKSFKIPGISTPITRSQPIYDGSIFTWNDALWGESTGDRIRMPESAEVTENVVALARYMERVWVDLGKPEIEVTSWYRDKKTNDLVGGARFSQHLLGNAIDFRIKGENVVTTFNKLKSFRRGTLSLAVGSNFIHLDLRPGAPARWRYPGGPVVALW